MSEKHPKQDFQVERLAFFSDAVFAIAITLLVIEFKTPEITKESTYAEVWKELLGMKYKFFALILSFALIARYWMRHHTLFKYIHNYNKQILVVNMWVLLPIIFFPFSTTFFYESTNNEQVLVIPYRIFVLNNILANGAMYYFYFIITKRYRDFIYPMEKKDGEDFGVELLIICVSFILVFLLSFISFKISLLGILPIPVFNFYRKYFKKGNNR